MVIGSQAVLGSWSDRDLPDELIFSQEVDLIPPDDSQEKRDLIDGTIGEFSQFHESFGIWAHGVAETTAVLPADWQARLVPYRSRRAPGVLALCLEAHDLWVAKAMRADPKDVRYCRALAASGRINRAELLQRLDTITAPQERIALARSLVESSFRDVTPEL